MRCSLRSLLGVVLATVLGLAPAWGQTGVPLFPQTLPANTVVGRIGAGVAGPAQAIPFATLASQLGLAATSVSNSDGTLTVSPTTGAIIASLALSHANTWTGAQTFTNSLLKLLGSSTGVTTFASANSGASNFTITFPATTGTVALVGTTVTSISNSDGTLTISPTSGDAIASLALGHANTWTAAQTFTNSLLKLLGSSTGVTTFTSANAGASNFTITVPAITGTLITTADTGTIPTAALAAAAVTYAKIQNVAGLSVVGRSASSSGVSADITGTANQFLGVNSAGTTLGFQTMSGDATLASGVLTIANAAVTYAKFQNIAGLSVAGRSASSSGVGADITGTAGQFLAVNAGGTALAFQSTASLAQGGTNASLTASNGGIFYSTGSAGAILSGTATAGQILRSGSSAAPAWSTATYPATVAISTILYGSSSNVVDALATCNAGVIATNSTGVPSCSVTPTLGVNGTTTGQLSFASGGASGASVTVQNPSATAAYSFNLPATAGTAGQPLLSGGGAGTAQTYGTLQPAAGGSGVVSPTAHGVLIAQGASPFTSVTTSSTGQCLVSTGSGTDPVWGSCAAGSTVAAGNNIVVGSSNTVIVQQMEPGGRLTLTSGTPVMTVTTLAQTAIYYAPYKSGWVPIYDGSSMRLYCFLSSALCQTSTDTVGLTLTLGSNWAINSAFDVFVTLNGGVATLCTVAWTNVTTRATALIPLNGIYTNSGTVTCRNSNSGTLSVATSQGTYLGSFYTNASLGTVDFGLGAASSGGTPGSIGFCNFYNRRTVPVVVTDSGTTYTYTTATTRLHRGVSFTVGTVAASSGLAVTFMNCMQDQAVWAAINHAETMVLAAAASTRVAPQIDSITTLGSFRSRCWQGNAAGSAAICDQVTPGIFYPGIGQHYIAALEVGDGTNANTFNNSTTDALNVKLEY
jgi:hypothetical protein